MKSDNYVVIQGWMCNELGLKGNELLVYALINGFSQDEKSDFHGGRKYIADTFNISLPTVDKALEGLLAKNLIIKIPCETQSQTDRYKINISSKETLLGGSKVSLLGGSKVSLPDNIYNKLDNNTDNTNVLSTEKSVDTSNDFLQYPSVKKPPQKKKGLYANCMDSIDEFTESEEVKNLLKDYLKVRLERKDKPFGINSFNGMLKKLRTLTDSKEECLKIIQQSIDLQYPSFFPLSKPKYRQECPELIEQKKNESITQEEVKEAIELGEKF